MNGFRNRLCDVMALESGLSAAEVAEEAGLMSTGILDSFALVAVIGMVESHLGQEIPPSDLTFANFDSVAAICAFVERANAV